MYLKTQQSTMQRYIFITGAHLRMPVALSTCNYVISLIRNASLNSALTSYYYMYVSTDCCM